MIERFGKVFELITGRRPLFPLPELTVPSEPIVIPTWKVHQDLAAGYRVSFDGTNISFLEVITSTDQDLFRVFAQGEEGKPQLAGYSISRHDRLPEWGVCGTEIWSIGQSEDDPGLNYQGALPLAQFMRRYQSSTVNGYLTEALFGHRERYLKKQGVPYSMHWLRDE